MGVGVASAPVGGACSPPSLAKGGNWTRLGGEVWFGLGGRGQSWVGVVCGGEVMLTPPLPAAACPRAPPGGVQPPPGGQQLLPCRAAPRQG